MSTDKHILELTRDIVAAYVSHNKVESGAIPDLLKTTYTALKSLHDGDETHPLANSAPAVPIEESITSNYIICLENGRKYKSLKRHLRTQYGLTPQAYREKWGLPADYPMVASSYSKQRSKLAKRTGLGKS